MTKEELQLIADKMVFSDIKELLSLYEKSPIALTYYTFDDVLEAISDNSQKLNKELTHTEQEIFMDLLTRYSFPAEYEDLMDNIKYTVSRLNDGELVEGLKLIDTDID